MSATGYASERILLQQPHGKGVIDTHVVLGTDQALGGVVVNQNDSPVADAKVKVHRNSLSVSEQTTSDTNGRFHFDALLPGRYSVTAESVGDSGAVLPPTGDSLRISLETPGALYAQVEFSDGSAPRSVWVSVSTFAAGAASFAPAIGAQGGNVRLNKMPTGDLRIEMFGPQFTSLIRKDIVVRGGGVEDLGTIEVAHGRRITGLVVDSSGAAQANTRLL